MYRKGIYGIIVFILFFSLQAHAARLVWNANAEIDNGTKIFWVANTNSDTVGYKVYRRQVGGSYDFVVDVGNVTEYQVGNLSPGIYYFAVKAYKSSGEESEFSNEVSPNLAGYKIYRGESSRNYGSPIDIGKTTEYQITGLIPGKIYYFAVTAYNLQGTESGFSNEVTYVEGIQKIAAATNLAVVCRERTVMPGPLIVSPTNPRYFQDANGKLVYLTGSHTWGNLQDFGFNFMVDPNSTAFLKALWKFDSGALTTDSSGTGNALTNDGVDEETTIKKEGTGSAGFVIANTDFMYRTDTNWVGPWRSDDAVKTGSVCAWVRCHIAGSASDQTPFSKYEGGTGGKRSILCQVGADGLVYMALGFDNGAQAEWHNHATVLSDETWYLIIWTYDNVNKRVTIRIRNEDGSTVGTDYDAAALTGRTLFVTDAAVRIGAMLDDGALSCYFDGYIDRMAVFNRVITAGEATVMATDLLFDWDAYITFLTSYGHNYTRIWVHETDEGTPLRYSMNTGGKLDVTTINQALLDRLKTRVAAASTAGIYVGITLFRPDAGSKAVDWPIHHFNINNNSNSINGDTNSDGHGVESYAPLASSIEAIYNAQKAWIEAVVDEVNEYDNVLYEVGNEGDWTSHDWQYEMIAYIKSYEATKPKQHPIIMSSVQDQLYETWAPDDSLLIASDAEAVGFGTLAYGGSPAVADGSFVSILDNDHFMGSIAAPKGQWPWRCFMRGHNSILMDSYLYGDPSDWTVAEQLEMRNNMGYTKGYASKMGLASMIPQASGTGTPSETDFCLYNTGHEYLFFQPDAAGASFDIVVTTKKYHYEWFQLSTGTVFSSGVAEFSTGEVDVPFNGPAVLWLREEKEIQGAFRGINRGIMRGAM